MVIYQVRLDGSFYSLIKSNAESNSVYVRGCDIESSPKKGKKIIMVIVEGGVVREVCSNWGKCHVEIIDFDPKGDDPEEDASQERRRKFLRKHYKFRSIY